MRIHTLLEFRWQDDVLVLLREEGFDYAGPLALCDRSTSGKIANQSIANSSADQANAETALGSTNTALTNYSNKLNNFMKFGRSTYGANGTFMKDENTLANTTAAAGETNLKGNLALNALKTGANTAGYADTAAESQREGEEAVTNQLATADASRLQQLTAVNQYGVQASALPAEVQAGLYGTSIGGANSALGVASSASAADPSFADTLPGDLGAAIGAAGNVATGFTPNGGKGCWIAAAVFDEDFATGVKTGLVRNWLHEEFALRPAGRILVPLYVRFGERIAEQLQRYPLLKTPFRWLFNRALTEAKRWAKK